MKVSCICPTYNRVAVNPVLLEEAVQSFIIQDHPDKELIILNDHAGQIIKCNHPQIRVINLPKRFETLGQKYNYAIAQSTGDLICTWEDDDISLSNRLSYSVAQVQGYNYFNPRGYWYFHGSQLMHTHPIGYSHNCSIFTREAFNGVCGYHCVSGPQDAKMDSELRCFGKVSPKTITRDYAQWFFIYRWGESNLHLSAFSDTQKVYRDYAASATRKMEITLNPRWRVDYHKVIRDYMKEQKLEDFSDSGKIKPT